MSFGAMAGWQAWLLIAAAGTLAVWLFLLKLRPPRILVPSLLLWGRVLGEARELTLWERIRRTVSLLVTVLVALTLALAASRPAPKRGVSSAAPHGRMLIVIDSSWSMLARTRSGATRWDRAIAEARRIAASGDEVALATTADGLVEGPTTDLALIETRLDRIAPGGGDATSWPHVPGTEAVHFITDGGTARPLAPGVVLHTVFEAAPNVAITAFDVRPSLSLDHAADAYLEIANYAPSAQTVGVTLTRGEAVIAKRELNMAAGEAVHQVTPLGRGTDAALEARVEAKDNALSIDDHAFAWMDRARPLRVAVVGQRTGWLSPLLVRDPGVRVTFVDPASYRPEAPDVDAWIFDRWAPSTPAARPALYFAPPTDTPWLAAGTDASSDAAAAVLDERRPRWESAGSHVVMRGVDPLTIRIDRARTYQSSGLVAIAQSVRGTPLVAVIDAPGRRAVIVTFGPGDSNLPAAPGFPVLVGNALDWIARPDARAGMRPGAVTFDASVTKVTGPGGVSIPLARMDGAAIGVLRTPGLYVADGAAGPSSIAVNAGDPQISNVERTTLGTTAHALAVSSSGSAHPWWLYCAAAAFGLVIAEWWTWQRRITV